MNHKEPIAVVGVSCLFPQSSSLKEYWDLIVSGRDAIEQVPLSHWDTRDYFDPDPLKPDHTYAKRGGFLKPYRFNPLTFGIAPNALEATDSTQLLGMVAALEALKDAGYADKASFDRNRIACILGVTGTLELVVPLGARLGHPIWRKALERAGIEGEFAEQIIQDIADSYVPWQESSFPGLLGNVVAGRIANRLDLGGTNCVVDAACASSLGAIHTAVQELQSGHCDMAISGGMDTFNDIFMYMCFSKTPALSPSGDAKPFDADGDGTILGEGLGTVILRRLSDAEKDGDKIYGVIKGIGSSSDGRGKSIYAPSSAGQLKALKRAYDAAGFDPGTVGLFECHGTGTKVGDGVELEGLRLLMESSQTDSEHIFCAIGSVKSQIGHTKAAAGAAGLIKALLALHHKVLPPTIKIHKPHPQVHKAPFHMNLRAVPWFSGAFARRAGVSAFGFGGSNFHCVLEEYQKAKVVDEIPFWPLPVVFSASTKNELASRLASALRALKSCEGDDNKLSSSLQRIVAEAVQKPDSLSATSNWRSVILVPSAQDGIPLIEQAIGQLKMDSQNVPIGRHPLVFTGQSRFSQNQVGFLFPGQGAQYIDMARQLCLYFSDAFQLVERANQIWHSFYESSQTQFKRLSDYIWPPSVFTGEETEAQNEALRQTEIAQPALAVVSAIWLQFLRRLGLDAQAYAGHSFGELTALYAGGAISFDDFMRLAMERGRLMAGAGEGVSAGMLAVRCSAQELFEISGDQGFTVNLANDNSPTQVVLAGTDDEIAGWQSKLKMRKVGTKRLNVSTAFHSPVVARSAAKLGEFISSIDLQPLQKKVYSNVTARPYSFLAKEQRDLLSSQMASPVHFRDMVTHLYNDGIRVFVEVGPNKHLSGLVQSCLATQPSALPKDFLVTQLDGGPLRPAEKTADTWSLLLASIAELYVEGLPVDWSAISFTNPPSPREASGFLVDIRGANYRSPSVQRSSVNALPTEKHQKQKVEKEPAESLLTDLCAAKKESSLISITSPSPIEDMRTIMKKSDSKNPSFQSSLEGFMDSLLAIQKQTAEAHKAFLEQQMKTQENLQQVWSEYRQSLMPAEKPAASYIGDSHNENGSMASSSSPASLRTEKEEEKVVSWELVKDNTPQQSRETSREPSSLEDARSLVQEVIAACTGYPVDMVSDSMELEGDLGIDSIKRVEIFAQLGEKKPQWAQLNPDELSGLATVGEIAHFLAGSSGQTAKLELAQQAVERPPLAAAPSERIAADPSSISHKIYAIIAEKTGYPRDMLDEAMSLEEDLGIDSIKKVEIISALTEAPLAGEFHAEEQALSEKLSAAQTIKELMDLMSGLGAPVNSSRLQGAATCDDTLSVQDQEFISFSKVDDLKITIVDILAEKTGYPKDILQDEMNLEDDLGIDSIKRVEIVSAISEQIPQLGSLDEQNAQLQNVETIGGLVDAVKSFCDQKEGLTAHARSIQGAASQPQEDQAEVQYDDGAPSREAGDGEKKTQFHKSPAVRLERQLLRFQMLEAPSNPELVIPKEAHIWVVDDGSNLARNIALKLREKGCRPRLVSIAFVSRMKAPEQLDALILLTPLKLEGSLPRFLANCFKLVQLVGPALQNSADAWSRQGVIDWKGVFAVVSRNGGRFGYDGLDSLAKVMTGSCAGFAKTAHYEWPEVKSMAIDLGHDFADGFEATQRLLEACFHVNYREVGVLKEEYALPELKTEELPDIEGHRGKLDLRIGDSVLVTGGARGVTWAVIKQLAQSYPAHYVIWGRTPLLTDEQKRLFADCQKEADIIEILRGLASSKERKPVEIQSEAKRIIAAREIEHNLDTMRSFGAKLTYMNVDLSIDSQISEALTMLSDEGIQFKGLVHGAGLLRDRLISDLSEAEFREVVETKIRLLSYLDHSVFNSLNFAAFFSSSTARFGRKGQVAYAVANEALNKFTHYGASLKPNCRFVSLNWGPWDGGMVDAGLKALFKQEGIATIPLDVGASYFVSEIEQSRPAHDEIVLLAQEESLSYDSLIALDEGQFPVIKDHVIKGKYVFPVVLHMELMADAGKEAYPGSILSQVSQFRILKGISYTKNDRPEARLELEKLASGDECVSIKVKLFARLNGSEPWFLSSTATLDMPKSWPEDEPAEQDDSALPDFDLDSGHLYDEFLFHGPAFQGLEKIDGYQADIGVSARVRASSDRKDWQGAALSSLGRKGWSTDPLMIDAGFQAGVIWSSLSCQLRSLPVSFQSYRQYRPTQAHRSYRFTLQIKERSSHRFLGDLRWFDEAGHLIAVMYGYEAIMDASLTDSFMQSEVGSSIHAEV